MDPTEIIDNVSSYLLADASVVEAFGEKIKLTPFTSSVSGCIKGNVKYFTAFITYQLESKKNFGVASVVANQDCVQHIEIHVGGGNKILTVNLKPNLMDNARAYLLQDERVRKALGKGVSLRELTNGHDEHHNVQGQVVSHTCASFEVEGSKQIGVASVVANQHGMTELSVFIGEDMYTVEVPTRGAITRTTVTASSAWWISILHMMTIFYQI